MEQLGMSIRMWVGKILYSYLEMKEIKSLTWHIMRQNFDLKKEKKSMCLNRNNSFQLDFHDFNI